MLFRRLSYGHFGNSEMNCAFRGRLDGAKGSLVQNCQDVEWMGADDEERGG